jgi:type IV pilus assembly protein PilW
MPFRRRQSGLSLIELMIAMALGMGVVLASLALLQAARASYVAVNDNALVQDTGRYALDVLARAIRQANYVPYDSPAFMVPPAFGLTQLSPGVEGIDNSYLSGHTAALLAPRANTDNHGSDVLALRYFGSGNKADGSILNCAGFAVAAPVSPAMVATVAGAEAERHWSIFYVAADSTGEPELRCKYRTKNDGWHSTAIARGVEAFQVLYGIGDMVGGPITQYRNAARMSVSTWRQVIAIRIAILIRGEQRSSNGAADQVYDLFGPGYRDSLDPGVTISAFQLPDRIRKQFQITVQLRNPMPT